MIDGASATGGRCPCSSGTCKAAGSSSCSRPSSRRSNTVAAVKLLVIDAMRNTVSASGVVSAPTFTVPTPRVWTSSPSTMRPYATPGTGSAATNASTSPSTCARRSVNGSA